MDDLLILKWKNHGSAFEQLMCKIKRKETFTDVTLACSGKLYGAHKLVLSACSDYFLKIFEHMEFKDVVIVLKDISAEDLESLIEYMYIGEVNVKQTALSSLIKAAETLQIKGLAATDDNANKKRTGTSIDNCSSPKRKKQRSDDIISIKSQGNICPKKTSPSEINNKKIEQLEEPTILKDGVSVFVKEEIKEIEPYEVSDNDSVGDSHLSNESNMIKDKDVTLENTSIHDESIKEKTTWPDNDDPTTVCETWCGNDNSNIVGEVPNYSSEGNTSWRNNDDPTTAGEASNYSSGEKTTWRNNDDPTTICETWCGNDNSNIVGEVPNYPSGALKLKWKCTICYKDFLYESWLKEHHRMHTKERPFSCHLCSYKCNRKAHLDGHFLSRHDIINFENINSSPNKL